MFTGGMKSRTDHMKCMIEVIMIIIIITHYFIVMEDVNLHDL
jgi:hypothetical protein